MKWYQKAEIIVVTLLAKNNIQTLFADNLSSVMNEVFTDSKVAKGYFSKRRKTVSIMYSTAVPDIKEDIANKLKKVPFNISIDNFNDTNLEKMNPLIDINRSKVVAHFLDMDVITDSFDAFKSETLFQALEDCMNDTGLSWNSLIGFSVDNINANIGCLNSIKSRVLQ